MNTLMALALVLRVFDRSGDSAAERHEAIQAADSILREADVAATWIDCSRGSRVASHAVCTDPLGTGELAVRITAAPKEPRKPRGKAPEVRHALGYSLVEPAVGGTLATVFSDRVAWLATSSKSKYSTLLGRAVAHEIGHLLIGTTEHATSGLMRPVWTSAELTRNDRHDWLFTADDRTRLHRSRLGSEHLRMAESNANGNPDES